MEENKLKSFLDSLSFRDLTLSVDLAVTIGILYFYMQQLFIATPEMRADASFISSLLLKVIVVSIVLSIASSLLLEFVSDNDTDKPLDEREQKIELYGNKTGLWILQSGVCIAIFQYTAEAHNFGPSGEYTLPFLPLHIMVVAFMVSEVANYGTQLVRNRMGAVYG